MCMSAENQWRELQWLSLSSYICLPGFRLSSFHLFSFDSVTCNLTPLHLWNWVTVMLHLAGTVLNNLKSAGFELGKRYDRVAELSFITYIIEFWSQASLALAGLETMQFIQASCLMLLNEPWSVQFKQLRSFWTAMYRGAVPLLRAQWQLRPMQKWIVSICGVTFFWPWSHRWTCRGTSHSAIPNRPTMASPSLLPTWTPQVPLRWPRY